MTYHDQEFLVSQTSEAVSHDSKGRTFNNRNKNWYSSHHSPPESLRVECKAEERHFISDIAPYYNIDSYLKPIHFTMNDQSKPIQFRSEIIVHNDCDVDLNIKRLHVSFYCYDDIPPTNALFNQGTTPSNLPLTHEYSVQLPRFSKTQIHQEQNKVNDSRQQFQSTKSYPSNQLLHQWIDEICNHGQLLNSDNIVFLIKSGEFFARI